MGQILRNWRVITATLLSVVFIVGAFVLARGIESPSSAQASEETALLQAIAAKDSDSDGLVDWEEALYGTDPHAVDTFRLGMTDGEAVAKGLIVPKAIADISTTVSSSTTSSAVDGLPPPPTEGTLTAAFTQKLLTFYLSAKQAKGDTDLSQSEMNDIINQALDSLSSVAIIAPDYKSAKDITISGSGTDALIAFAVSAEAVLMKNTADATTTQTKYLKSAIENNDVTALPHIASIAKGYRNSAVGLSVLPVPTELAADGLMLINAMMRVSEITSDFTRVNDDPVATILALEQYPQAVQSLGMAFTRIGGIYAAAGISLPADAPGASFVNLIVDVAASQQAAGKP